MSEPNKQREEIREFAEVIKDFPPFNYPAAAVDGRRDATNPGRKKTRLKADKKENIVYST